MDRQTAMEGLLSDNLAVLAPCLVSCKNELLLEQKSVNDCEVIIFICAKREKNKTKKKRTSFVKKDKDMASEPVRLLDKHKDSPAISKRIT